MKETFKIVNYDRKDSGKGNIEFLNEAEAKKVYDFHKSFPVYTETPLVQLSELAKEIGVAEVFIKDESYRFGLNAFKVLGGSYAMGRYIADRLGESIENLTADKMTSAEVKEKLGDVTFTSATDGNHGRGVAWTAEQLNQKSIIYMPEGTAPERLERIIAHGSDASIVPMNYDEAVRLADKKAKEVGGVIVQDTAWEGYEEIPTWIMQGYMTMGYEIAQQMKELKEEQPTHIFLQAGVGSMAGAMTGFFANYYSENQPIITIIEPEKANCIFQTAEARDGKLHFVTGKMDTIMAGLACGEPNQIGWDVLNDYADAFISCPDYVAADGMRALAAPQGADTKVVSGESGAGPIGCMINVISRAELAELKESLKIDENSRLLFISTEGDTDRENYMNTVWYGKDSRFY